MPAPLQHRHERSMHDRACQAVAVATRSIRPAPPFVRLARAASQQPNIVERLMQFCDRLADRGASRDDLRAIEQVLARHLDDRFAGVRKALAPLLREALEVEGAANLMELDLLQHPGDRRLLREFARLTRREAALEVELADVADLTADALEAR